MWVALLILHAFAALLILGALTHQAVTVYWHPRAKRNLVESFAAVRASAYTNGVVVLFLIVFSLGSIIYTNYRLNVRTLFEAEHRLDMVGIFELKEHWLAVMLGLMPAYWYYWRRVPMQSAKFTRGAITTLLAAVAWWGFVAGHIIGNARGLQ